MSNLIEMQRAIYHTAGKYYALMGEYFAALHHQSPKLKEITDRCISAAEEYRAQLQALLDYAFTNGALEVDESNMQRIRRLLELLDLEIQCIRKGEDVSLMRSAL